MVKRHRPVLPPYLYIDAWGVVRRKAAEANWHGNVWGGKGGHWKGGGRRQNHPEPTADEVEAERRQKVVHRLLLQSRAEGMDAECNALARHMRRMGGKGEYLVANDLQSALRSTEDDLRDIKDQLAALDPPPPAGGGESGSRQSESPSPSRSW